MTFSLLYIAIPFAFLFLIWLVYSFFALGHAVKYGKTNPQVYFGVMIFLALSIITIFISWNNLQKVDWTYQIQIEN